MMIRRPLAILVVVSMFGCGGTVKFGSDAEVDTDDPDVTVDVEMDTVEDSPPEIVEDNPVDAPPDTTPVCIPAGCWMMPDGGLPCCAELDYVASCPPSDPLCPSPAYHCVDCGNGVCDPHETSWNCLSDCVEGCDLGAAVGYACGPMEGYDCTCQEPACIIVCEGSMMGYRWENTCTEESYGICSPTDDAYCAYIGTDSEGWYTRGPLGGEDLIVFMDCANNWVCYGYD